MKMLSRGYIIESYRHIRKSKERWEHRNISEARFRTFQRANVTAQLKALFDRSFAFGKKKPLDGKIGGAIVVGRGEGGGQSLALSSQAGNAIW